MSTLKDYIEHYKDISFDEIPFNEVDNLILAQLSYFELEGIVASNRNIVSFEKALRQYYERYPRTTSRKKRIGIEETIYLYYDLFEGKRFRDLGLSNYVNELSKEKQFSAILIHLPNHTVYVSYSGTDDTIIGWEEDFHMAYLFPVPAQERSISYLNNSISWFDRKIFVGGHSKGGNLAMVAAMYARPSIRSRIQAVYNNEGPGFPDEIFYSKAYQLMSKKLHMYIPEDSVIGVLFHYPSEYNVIKSTANGIWQHDGNTWECFGGRFIRSTRTKGSISNEQKIKQWLELYNTLERKKIVVNFFEVFKRSGITKKSELDNLTIRKAITIINQFRSIAPEEKQILIDSFKTFFTIYRGIEPKERKKKVTV